MSIYYPPRTFPQHHVLYKRSNTPTPESPQFADAASQTNNVTVADSLISLGASYTPTVQEKPAVSNNCNQPDQSAFDGARNDSTRTPHLSLVHHQAQVSNIPISSNPMSPPRRIRKITLDSTPSLSIEPSAAEESDWGQNMMKLIPKWSD